MDNVVSGLIFLLLGFLAFLSGLSANMWRREESRYRIGALIAGLLFMIIGILVLVGYLEIKDG
jgi:threonine/homoserine/homoserine lactone efflux protein